MSPAVTNKRGRLEFPPSEEERYGVTKAIRVGKLRTVWELLRSSDSNTECGSGEFVQFVRFLLLGLALELDPENVWLEKRVKRLLKTG